MKKTVNVLSFISVISIFIMIAIYISTRNSDLYIQFIAEWFFIIPGFLTFPILGWAFFDRDKTSPKIWLSIYAGIFLLLIYILGFDYVDQTRDLPMAFRKDTVSIEGEARYLDSTKSSQIFQIANQKFIVSNDDFNDVSRNNVYRVDYLPNSKYVIDIFDEDGRSLLKNRKK